MCTIYFNNLNIDLNYSLCLCLDMEEKKQISPKSYVSSLKS